MAYKNKEDKKEYDKQYYICNKEHRKQYHKQYYQENKEKQKQYSKQYNQKNKEHIKQYQSKNKEKLKEYKKQWNIDNKEYYNQYQKQKRRTDLKFNLNSRMSRAIRESLKGNKNGKHWEDLVGYTVKDLIKHLKLTLPPHYTWNDYMDGKLHIDHRIPIAAHNFDNSNQIDFKRCWALSNLQLLPAEENLIKGAKLEQPFQPALKMAI